MQLEDLTLQLGDQIALAAYFAVVLAIGVWGAKKSRDTEGYFVGGRSIPGWAVGLSLLGTGISSVSFLAYPGSAYAGDWSLLVPGLTLPFATAIGVYFFVPFYRASRYTSANQYLEDRFSVGVRVYGCLLFTILSAWRIGSILYLLCLALVPLTGWDIETLIILMGIFVTLYTVTGGIEAVIWTDVLQTVVLTLGGVGVIAVVFFTIDGGPATVLVEGWRQQKFHLTVDLSPSLLRETLWVLILNGLFLNLQELASNQTFVQRYCAANSDGEAKRAVWFTGLASIPMWTMFMFVGTCLFIFYRQTNDPAVAGLASDAVFPHFIVHQLPVGVSGFLIAAVMAAAMSSIDSSMNGTATILTIDIYKRLLATEASDKHYLIVARLLTSAMGVVMVAIAFGVILLGADSILDWAFVIGAIVLGGMGGVYFLGFFSTRANWQGVSIGILCAFASIVYLTLCEVDSKLEEMGSKLQFLPEALHTDLHPFLIGAVANVISFTVGYLASLLFPPPSAEKLHRATWWTREKAR